MSILMTTRRRALRLGLAGASLSLASTMFGRARAEALPPVVVWKDANCGCCEGWVRHMRDAGFGVTVRDVGDMAVIKRARNVPDALQSCHTAVVAGYVIEGHVPWHAQSAPGMDQPGEPYKVVMFGTPTGDQIYAQY